jgi:hypothetical protein
MIGVSGICLEITLTPVLDTQRILLADKPPNRLRESYELGYTSPVADHRQAAGRSCEQVAGSWQRLE